MITCEMMGMHERCDDDFPLFRRQHIHHGGECEVPCVSSVRLPKRNPRGEGEQDGWDWSRLDYEKVAPERRLREVGTGIKADRSRAELSAIPGLMQIPDRLR